MNKRKTQFEERVERKLKTQKVDSDVLRHTDQCENIVEEKEKILLQVRCSSDPMKFPKSEEPNVSLSTLKECPNVPNDQWKVQLDDDESSLIGDHETQESEGGEADLHKHFDGCKKNPGHRQFIPVDTFSLKHLSEGLQDKDLYEYIKVIADQTVRVSVTMISPHRPKFLPETTQPYPFYNMSERRILRTGSGRVWNVNKFQDGVRQDEDIGDTAYTKCWCRKCEGSNSPSNVWWEFVVHTATHVVFDDNEANHTTLRLFYDKVQWSVLIRSVLYM